MPKVTVRQQLAEDFCAILSAPGWAGRCVQIGIERFPNQHRHHLYG
jgi:hypothetical protein